MRRQVLVMCATGWRPASIAISGHVVLGLGEAPYSQVRFL